MKPNQREHAAATPERRALESGIGTDLHHEAVEERPDRAARLVEEALNEVAGKIGACVHYLENGAMEVGDGWQGGARLLLGEAMLLLQALHHFHQAERVLERLRSSEDWGVGGYTFNG